MTKNYKIVKSILSAVAFFAFANNINAQCTISGINASYCADDAAVTMVGSPAGGTFSGTGVTGDSFDPATAGTGGHTITYTYTAVGNKYYIKSNTGNPWGQTTNDVAMDQAFGAGNWMLEAFETANVGTVFAPTTSFVFIDGSDSQASELNTFLLANLATIETWVLNGGALLMNSAPNEGGNMNFGFGATTLSYDWWASSVTVQDLLHPAYVGPNTPTASVMTGNSYGHAQILGTGFTNLLLDSSSGQVVLCEKAWGAGRVMLGGMTTNNYHTPLTEAANWRANLLVYMNGQSANGGSCSTTFDVTVNELPSIDAAAGTDEMFGNDGTIDLTVSGGAPAYTFDWDNDGTGDNDDTEDLSGLVAGTYNVIVVDANGCSATQSVTIGSQVGVEELSNIEVNVSPNPATEMITINIVGPFNFVLTDLNGSEILNGNGTDATDVNISSLAKGVYLLTVEMNEKAKTMQVVKH